VSVESAQSKLRRQHHEPEKKGNGRNVDGSPGVFRLNLAQSQQKYGPKKSYPRAIEGQARDFPQKHSKIHKKEHRCYTRIHSDFTPITIFLGRADSYLTVSLDHGKNGYDRVG
jgi:hypothetical protein